MSQRVEELLAALTLDEKASLTSGSDMWHGHAVERLGIPALKVSDGPVGVRGDRWVGTTSACAPCGTALGATWNPELLGQVGQVLGEEAIAKSVDILLAPTVNLHRNALAGRNFECYSEDPHLTARSAVAMINGIESTGVGACIKHFVANDSEYQRHTISSEVSERVLRELYLIPFEAAVAETSITSVMSAYNRLNGTYCAEHEWLLTDVLRSEWGFDGIVISDWWGTMSSASAEAGLDIEMPGPAKYMGSTLAELVTSGELQESILDAMVTRILSTYEKLGLLDAGPRPEESSVEVAAHRTVLRRAAQEAIVLLRNEPVDGAPLLPLSPTVRRVAVIGPNADVPAALGGGSALVNPHRVSTVLDGLREALGDDVEIVHEIGVSAYRTTPPIDRRRLSTSPAGATGSSNADDDTVEGIRVEYFANRNFEGDPVYVETIASPRLNWMGDEAAPGVRTEDFSVRMTAKFTADVSGDHTFSLVTGGTGGRVLLAGETILDNYAGQIPGTAFFGLGSAEITSEVHLEAGESRQLICEFTGYEGLAVAALLVGHLPPIPADGIERAAAAAADADVAIVVVGLNQDSETEGEDRQSTRLPGRQDELLEAVISANPATVVLVNAGSAVDLSAAASAPALAQIWYLGQEAGVAVADILTGAVSPSGRLPSTFGEREEDWPSYLNYPGSAGQVLYGEELFMGYRGFDRLGIDPAFCFGHGLSYSTFSWAEPTLSTESLTLESLQNGENVDVVIEVKNTGSTTAADVVQVYVHDEISTLTRPDQELRAFAKVELAPGESRELSLTLNFRSFAAWDPTLAAWNVEPGRFQIRLARSSRDVVAQLNLDVTE
ncbi:MAG TPA: beta-glucosidase [Microthrixaceae bacterium]|nr:beta-glucosidase [Microthrixaceae bacterium]